VAAARAGIGALRNVTPQGPGGPHDDHDSGSVPTPPLLAEGTDERRCDAGQGGHGAHLGADELWQCFCATGCEYALADLITMYVPLVRFVASRLLPMVRQHVHHDTLVEYGVIGLTEAIMRFEPGRGVRFATFAVPRIRGSILDEVRAVDWTPRSVRSKARTLAMAYEELQWALHRSPTHAEVATRVGWSLEEVDRVTLLVQRGSVGALDQGAYDLASDAAADPAAILEQREEQRAVRHAVVTLRERERQVIELYYFEEYTLAQIADVLGVTEGRVSQIRSRAVAKMTDKLWTGDQIHRSAS
jgi:RNA polymerase sigma factor for flagellar operon FliA